MTHVSLDQFNDIPAADTEQRVTTYRDQLEAYERERSDPAWQPVRLGFGTIDTTIRGVSPGQVLGFAARTSVGKTWMIQTIEHNFSIRDDAGILSLTLEMPGPEWAERAVAIHDDVEPAEVERWAIAGELVSRSDAFLDRMKHVRIVEEAVRLDDLHQVIAEARASLDVPLRLLLVDYLGLLNVAGRDAYERTSAIGKGIKAIAKREKLAVVVAMQLSRAGGDGSEPVSLEMLRDSGVLEESVDFLLGAWQPGRSEKLNDEIERLALVDVLCVKVLKSRKGGEGRTVDLRFHAVSRRLYEEDPCLT